MPGSVQTTLVVCKRSLGQASKLDAMPVCEDCDATCRFGGCNDLFNLLLSSDHQRLSPWGPHHGLNVACYYLQHSSVATAKAANGQWALIEAYRRGKLPAVNPLESQWVARNRQGRFDPNDAPRVPVRKRRPQFTIEALSVDGTFPAEGYRERTDKWVASIIFERAVT